jgi:Family of unknown function (DUF6064)
MQLPFTHEQFIDVFARYNAAVWPAWAVAYLLAAGLPFLLRKPDSRTGPVIGGGLAAMWLFTGIAYHWAYFTSINKAAWAFGLLFIVQGLALIYVAVVRRQLEFGPNDGLSRSLGWAFVVYATVIYPLIGFVTGSEYPAMPMFGIAPCPVTIFTFGVLLLARGHVPRCLLVIPVTWSLIGGSAAFLLRVPQDWLLLVSGLVSVPVLLMRERARHPVPA